MSDKIPRPGKCPHTLPYEECDECRTPSSLAAPAGSAARTPATVFPVGSFILDEMQERGWSIEELNRRMGGDPVTQLAVELLIRAPTKGTMLDENTASLLSAAFGTSKELWLKLDEAWEAWQESSTRQDAADDAAREAYDRERDNW